MKCMHCGHPIKKVKFMSLGQSMWEYRHTYGGRYCNAGGKYAGCHCSNAEPMPTPKEASTEARCPICGETNPEMLDWRWDDKNNTVWECFECGHTWEVPHVI